MRLYDGISGRDLSSDSLNLFSDPAYHPQNVIYGRNEDIGPANYVHDTPESARAPFGDPVPI